jgi:hypothetical protein
VNEIDPLLIRHEAGHLCATDSLSYIRRAEVEHEADGSWAIHSHPPMPLWRAEGDVLFALLAGPVGECVGRIPRRLIVEDVVRGVSKYGSHDFQLIDTLLSERIVSQADIDSALARVLDLFETVNLDDAAAELAQYMKRIPRGRTGVMERPTSLTAVQ